MIKHGHALKVGGKPAWSRTYSCWMQMKSRCYRPKTGKYENYGGRGIRVCPRWVNDFAAFLADMGGCPPGLSLDRNDSDKDYEPGNCRWATPTEQGNNTRSNVVLVVNGRAQTGSMWARELGVRPGQLLKQISTYGWPLHRVLRVPPDTPIEKTTWPEYRQRNAA